MASGHMHNKLSAVRVKALRVPGKYEVGCELRLIVGPSAAKRWRAATAGMQGC